MSYVRTAKHRVMRSQMIHQWKPWLKSTGAKTEEGKAVSSMNAYKGGVRQRQRELTGSESINPGFESQNLFHGLKVRLRRVGQS